MKAFNVKYLVVAALVIVGLSGCSARGVVSDPNVRTYQGPHPLYADLKKADDGGYEFTNFGFSSDENVRRVNLSNGAYLGDSTSGAVGCVRGLLGLLDAGCDEGYQFTRSYVPPGWLGPNVLITPFVAIPALFIGSGSSRFLPLAAEGEFDYRAYNQAIVSAQERDGFGDRYSEVVSRYNFLHSEYLNLRNDVLSHERKLLRDFQSSVDVDVRTRNLSAAVPSRHVSHLLSSPVMNWKASLSVDQNTLTLDPFYKSESFGSLGALERFLDGVQETLAERRRTLEAAYVTVTPELRRSVKSNLNDYLASVQLPDRVVWRGFHGDRHSATAVFTFHDAATINKKEAEEAMKALSERMSAEHARESRLNSLRSSIGRKYCANGELSYVTRICSRNVGGIDRDVTEPGQLHAYLEGVSEDGLRIQLRVHHWATDAGRLQAGAVSGITFSRRQSLGNPSYGFSLGRAFTQRAEPGLVFWSDAASWSQCSR